MRRNPIYSLNQAWVQDLHEQWESLWLSVDKSRDSRQALLRVSAFQRGLDKVTERVVALLEDQIIDLIESPTPRWPKIGKAKRMKLAHSFLLRGQELFNSNPIKRAGDKSSEDHYWVWLRNAVAWLEEAAAHTTQHVPTFIQPSLEHLRLEGFRVSLVGLPEALSLVQSGNFRSLPETWQRDRSSLIRTGGYINAIKASLREFRRRGDRVLPWIVKYAPAINFLYFHPSGRDVRTAGGFYSSRTKEVSITPRGIWYAEGDPALFIHLLAHEMGHYFFRQFLSEKQRVAWRNVISQDYYEFDLAEALPRKRKDESPRAYSLRIENEHPYLQLRLAGLSQRESTPQGSSSIDHYDGPLPRGRRTLNLKKLYQRVRARERAGLKSIVEAPVNPTTGYGAKNPEEAFCEILGRLVAYGPRTLPKKPVAWLKRLVPEVSIRGNPGFYDT